MFGSSNAARVHAETIGQCRENGVRFQQRGRLRKCFLIRLNFVLKNNSRKDNAKRAQEKENHILSFECLKILFQTNVKRCESQRLSRI